jgi:hypothetical protein
MRREENAKLLKGKLYLFYRQVLGFAKKYNELITIPIALVLWTFSGTALRFFDPTAATYDLGIFQKVLFVIIVTFILCGFIRIVMKLQWPELDKYLGSVFNLDFSVHRNLTPYQKICVSLAVYFLLFFACIVLFLSI